MDSNNDKQGTGSLPFSACVIGCGVIGSGWAARLSMCGVNVRLFDPSPNAPEQTRRFLDQAALAWDLLDLERPATGQITWHESIPDSVEDGGPIFECGPERLEAKHAILTEIDRHAAPETLVTSSTSGFRPSQLAEPLQHRERFLVAHPFNPVYLLPLVELVPSKWTGEAQVDQASRLVQALGMKPLRVRREIDAFIANRLLESMWREALWLINDGVATTQEIDDAVRYGFGLRWAQMGMFEQYRIAGGDGGMEHFLGQFGEALDWPWSHMTDTPEMDNELIKTICLQSDEQSGQNSLAELERVRDANLVAILRALEERGQGAGETLAQFRSKTADNEG